MDCITCTDATKGIAQEGKEKRIVCENYECKLFTQERLVPWKTMTDVPVKKTQEADNQPKAKPATKKTTAKKSSGKKADK